MTSGRYRVTLTGFTVQSETWDDPFQWDGKRDEVFIRAKVVVTNKDGGVLSQGERVSQVMGDTNNQNGRIKAGTASDKGGLRSGDSFPTATPWIASTAPSTTRNYPPMKLWEGDLHQGQDVCLITPSIWEDDTSGPILNDWVTWSNSVVKGIGPEIRALIATNPLGQAIFTATELGLGVAVSAMENGVIGASGDRPIGMKASGKNQYTYDPTVLFLTADIADHLIRTEPVGLDRGIVPIVFEDDVRLQGNYVVYLKVEKLGSLPNPVPAPTVNGAQVVSQQVPASVRSGDDFNVSFTLRNTGTRTWSSTGPNPHRLGSQNPQDTTIWGQHRIELPHPVAPGQEVTFRATLRAPIVSRTNRTINMQWRMVQDGVQWFGDATANRGISVTFTTGPVFERPKSKVISLDADQVVRTRLQRTDED